MTVATVDIIGRKPIQLGGCAILVSEIDFRILRSFANTLQTILFCIFGFAFNKLSDNGLLALYVIAQFFFNFGPNATTFIVPGECFPTRYRSTSHGFSAASGKLGAVIAQAAISPLRVRGAVKGAKGRAASPWLDHVMEIFALFMFLGIFTTLCIPETKRRTLEELSGEEGILAGTPDSALQDEKNDATNETRSM